MTAITAEQLAEWKALADAATEGPWMSDRSAKIRCPAGYDVAAVQIGAHERRANKLLIAAARTAVPALVAEVERLRAERDARQQIVADWCVASFGVGAASSLQQRAVRLLEEVIEAYQATGADPAMAHKLIDFVFSRPVGELSQEIGGVGLVLLSLANAAGVSADAEEAREVARVLAKPPSHWAARNANKNAAGFNTAIPPEEPANG